MREHKFRIWFYDGEDLKSGEWVSLEIAYRENYVEWLDNTLTPTDECTIIVEWTGLTDNDGKEWYEGDICQCVDPEDKSIFQILYVAPKFVKRYAGKEDDFVLDITYFELKWFEVIGNRFENPELLET